MKTILIWLGVIVISLAAVMGLYYLSAQNNPGTGNSPANLAPVSAMDWKLGGQGAKAVLVEYGDYECPACGYYAPEVVQLNKDFGSSLLIVYRQFPLSQHKNANLASRSAEAAGKQGKFWEMHEKLFATQKDWAESNTAQNIFESYASGLGLDVNKFRSDLNSADIAQKIQNDIASGNAAGLQGTPTFFLNGVEISNPQTYQNFRDLIQAKL